MFDFTSARHALRLCEENRQFSIAHIYERTEEYMNIHSHFCYELYFSKTQKCQMTINGQNKDISPGNLLFIQPGLEHCLSRISVENNEHISIFIHPDYLSFLSSEDTLLETVFFHQPNRTLSLDAKSQKQFYYMILSLKNITKNLRASLQAQSLFLQLLMFVSEKTAEFQADFYPETQKNALIQKVTAYINQNIQNPLSLETIAAEFYISPNYLCRLFKDTTGRTLKQYITRQRIERAKLLLANGLSAGNVCASCGYNDYSSFFRNFLRETGTSPREYLKYH